MFCACAFSYLTLVGQACGLDSMVQVEAESLKLPKDVEATLYWLRDVSKLAQDWHDYWKHYEWVWIDPPRKRGAQPYLWSRRTG